MVAAISGYHGIMDISYILAALVVGLIAGLLARALLPGRDSMGLVPTIALGLVGSVVGSLLFGLVGIGDDERFDVGGLVSAVIGAMIVLGAYNAITHRKAGARGSHGRATIQS